jgi:hypothetical protein
VYILQDEVGISVKRKKAQNLGNLGENLGYLGGVGSEAKRLLQTNLRKDR